MNHKKQNPGMPWYMYVIGILFGNIYGRLCGALFGRGYNYVGFIFFFAGIFFCWELWKNSDFSILKKSMLTLLIFFTLGALVPALFILITFLTL